MVINSPISIQEFDKFIYRPENLERSFEYIQGDILEVVSNQYSSQVAGEILFQIKLHMKTQGIKGHVTGADGGYQVGEDRFIPDVGFVSLERQPKPSRASYNTIAPDLAVEVMSPTDDEKKLRIKIVNYLAQNVVVWLVNPDDETVEIYRPGQAVTLFNKSQVIDGAPIFPQLQLPVSDIFPDDEQIDNE